MKVFELTDCEWWMAETLEQAIADYLKLSGMSPEQAEADHIFDEPGELGDAAMDKLIFNDDDGKRTFREELKQRIAAGCGSELFATTEY